MIKVFLVEDEFVVREGIKKNVDWAGHGYEFCGDASDGEMAFPMIKKAMPDIVITDIKMPFMDGIELSRLLKKELPSIEIIILSGYEEFEYAKAGIEIGVARYLTKPINGNDLLKELDLLSVKIQERNKEKELKNQYVKEMEENRQREKKDLFKEMVSGNRSMTGLLGMAEKLELDIASMWYNIVLMKASLPNNTQDGYSDEYVTIDRELCRLEEKGQVLQFDRDLEGKAFLYMADSKDELMSLQKDNLAKIKNILEAHAGIRYFIGIGEPVERLTALKESYEAAARAFAHRYLVKENMMLYLKDEKESLQSLQEEFNIANVEPKQVDRTKVRDFLRIGDGSETRFFVEEYFRELGNSAMSSLVFRQYIMMDLYFCVAEFAEELGWSKDEIEPLDITKKELQTKEGSMEYLIGILRKAIELRDKAASTRHQDVVDEILQYIEEKYADEELSLNTIAEHVNFSPNHLSTVFSKQTGQTFIKYLTDFRMTKAKELLRCTGKRSSEISIEVGYRDPHYFSYLFKKTQGVTPTQYRGGKGAEEE